MKTLSILAITLLSFFTDLFMSHTNECDQPSQAEIQVNETLNKTAQLIKKRYKKMRASGEGAAMHGGIVRELMLAFDTSGPFTKEYLRQLLIEIAQDLLDQINTNKDLQPFLIKSPFTIENVQIIIYNSDKNGREVYDPGISIAEISQGILTYKTVDSNDTNKYKNRFKETYDEALAIVKSSQ
jgi:hypothetical protein